MRGHWVTAATTPPREFPAARGYWGWAQGEVEVSYSPVTRVSPCLALNRFTISPPLSHLRSPSVCITSAMCRHPFNKGRPTKKNSDKAIIELFSTHSARVTTVTGKSFRGTLLLISDPDPVNNKSARNNGPSLCLQRQMGLRPSLCHEHYVTRRVTHMTRTNCHGPGVTMPDCHSGYLNIILKNGSFDKRRFITCAKTRRIVSQRSENWKINCLQSNKTNV